MRSTRRTAAAAAAAIALLASSAGIASAMPLDVCLTQQSADLASETACGEAAAIAACFESLHPAHVAIFNPQSLKLVQECLMGAGCSRAEAKIEAQYTIQRCIISVPGSLRKRQPTGANLKLNARAPATPTPAPVFGGVTQVQAPKTSNKAAAGTPAATKAAPAPVAPAPADDPVAEDEDPDKKTTPQAAAATTTAAPVVVQQQDEDTTTTSATGTTGPVPPSLCFTTTMVSVTVCPVETTGANKGKQGTCFPTTAPTSVCAQGLICKSDAQGNPSCMRADNNIPVSGLIVAIALGSAVAAAVVGLIFFGCRERAQHRRLEAQAEAAAIARDAKIAAAKAQGLPVVNVHEYGTSGGAPGAGDADDAARPLIQPPSPQPSAHGGTTIHQQQQGGFGAPSPGYGQQDPFGDQHHIR